MATRRIQVTGVTFANARKPGREFKTTAQDRLKLESASVVDGGAHAYLRFAVDIPRGEQLVSATLEVVAEEVWPGSRTLGVQRVVNSGPLGQLNWNNRPDTAVGSVQVSQTQAGTDRRWAFDVTDDAALGGKITWRIISSDETVRWLKSKRRNRGAPRLVLVTAAIPDTPTDVEPSGVVSVPAPTFTWTAQVDIDQVQLQVDEADGDFTTPLWDSGAIPSVIGQVDTAAEGWTGIASGVEVDVRVRQHLPVGWSAWSNPVRISRIAKPTVTITNPPASDADPTPPVAWTTAGGGAQTVWQVIVRRDGIVVADSEKNAGTDQLWTPPKGARRNGDILDIEVRVWDDVDRAPSVGDPDYASATVTMTYTRSSSVAPASGLNLRQETGLPAVVLTWWRTSLSDGNTIERNGLEVEHLDEPGTSWTDWTAPPNTPLTYRVHAVVNGDTAASAPTAQITPEVTGVWLVDPDTGRGFRLSGTDGLDISYGEVAGVHTPIAAAALIRRTTAMRGAEGSIRGWISEWPDRTEGDQVADLWWMKTRPRKVWRLIMGDLNIPVTVSGLQTVFDPQRSFTNRIRHVVSFGFSQTGDELPFDAGR